MPFEITPGTVYFVGAGPGAPDLITLRGRSLIEAADVLLFADSLIDEAHTQFAKPSARVVGSSGLTLEEIAGLVVTAARDNLVVVRLQSGDPSVYGAMHEQLAVLRAAEVPCVVVPGVNSAFAAAAALGIELTVPSVAQTVILTRASGRASPVPPRESLIELAAHEATLALYLSASIIDGAVADLIAGGYASDTPAAVAYRVSWEDELLLRCGLEDVPATIQREGLTRTVLVLVGRAIAEITDDEVHSQLYDASYTHRYRRASE